MSTPILLATGIEKTVRNTNLFEKKYVRTLWKIPRLEVNESGFYVIAGKNGSGKSTLIRCLLGLLQTDSGAIAWFGQQRISAKLIGYLPEFPVIPPAAKVRYWLSWLLDISMKDLVVKDSSLAKFATLSIEHLLDVPANRLSKGQLQRVQLWAALFHEPRVVILDEPFSGLDPWARVELANLLKAIVDSGTSIFMSTHELPQVLRHITTKTWLIQNETVEDQIGCTLPS